jgi:hypothetical protein
MLDSTKRLLKVLGIVVGSVTVVVASHALFSGFFLNLRPDISDNWFMWITTTLVGVIFSGVAFLLGFGFNRLYYYIRYGATSTYDIETIIERRLAEKKHLTEARERILQWQKEVEQEQIESDPDYKEAMQELDRSFK